MKISVPLSREIYGGEPWMLDGNTYQALRVQIGSSKDISFELDYERLNYISSYNIKSGEKTKMEKLSERRSESSGESADNSPRIAVTLINGPITKSGGASSTGMKEICADLRELDRDPNVIGHIIQIDSGGGSSSGMEVMNYCLLNLTKPKVGLVERSGMAASAAYGILSHTDFIMAEDVNSEVGSIGTMISFAGFPSGEKDKHGQRHIRAYATASTAKNKAFEEAINTGNTDLLVSEVLDPFNKRFLANTKERRPNMLETQLDGSMYNAGDVVGTMVDSIGSFGDAVNKVLELSKATTTFNKKNNNKATKAMTAAEVLSQHPTVHAEIMAAGVSAERDRVETWMVYRTIDPDAVQKGIESGKLPTNKEMATFNLKAASSSSLQAIVNDSPKDLVPKEAKGQEAEKTADQKEFEALYPKANFTNSLSAN